MSQYDALIKALQAYIDHRPAFRVRPIGAPGSPARVAQQIEIEIEDQALAAIARATGAATGLSK